MKNTRAGITVIIGTLIGIGRVLSAWSDSPPSTPERRPISVDELHLLEPFWNSEIVYREALFFVQEDAEHPPAASLLFMPAEVISLHSATGETTYELGKDYLVQAESRRIVLTQDSRIPSKKREELYRKKGQSHAISHKTGDPGTLLYFGEGHFFHDQQAEITYRRGGQPWQGSAPKRTAKNLPRTLAALKARRPLSVCLTGDSIAEGGNASGSRGVPPYTPPFGELFALGLERAFDTKITLKNVAVGGKTADYGVQTAADIAATKPDLVLIAYGMNDVSRRDPVRYRTSVEQIIGRVRESSPETEFILVAPMLGNPEWHATPAEMFPKYRDALALLCGNGVALADVTTLWADVLKRKHYHDLTGNGVNHTNDFGHRLYAQVILGLLVEMPPFVNHVPPN